MKLGKNKVQQENKENIEVQTEESVENIEVNETDSKIAELEAALVAKQAEVDELVNKVKALQAETINYRARKDKEVADTLKYCNQGIVTDLIPSIDNFERAIKLDDNNLSDELSKFLEGFKMIYSSLFNTLQNYGVEVINRKGEVYDSNLEQALLTDNVEGVEEDVVLEVLQKGYKLKDRVIRPATVKINQK